MKYLIPAKTFLFGEYSALAGGSVLGLGTKSGFEVNFLKQANADFPFHLESPAGVLWSEEIANQNGKNNWHINFVDLLGGVGGFGRSTAEYLSVLILQLEKNQDEFSNIRKKYQILSSKGGAGASGADLAIQYFGNVTYFNSIENSYSSKNWNYKGYDFILVSTGFKIKTHEHILQLDLNKIKNFPLISNEIIKQCLNGDGKELVLGLKEWANFLLKNSLTHDKSVELKTSLESDADILCAKPCGALGADVILIVCEQVKTKNILEKLKKKNLTVQATAKDLCPGIYQQLSWSNLNISGDLK
ncbi:MAG: hypothetical protein WA160_12795 [Pseudobdellovibrio sp.]